MVSSVMTKPFNAFAYIVDKELKLENKVKDFAEKIFNDIKAIEIKNIKNIPSKAFNYIKENKFTFALAASSLAISAAVFVNISATASLLFLGAVAFIKGITYTREYVKSYDYQFKKLANEYIKSIEDLSINYKKGKPLKNNLETGYLTKNFSDKQLDIIYFIKKNTKNYFQFSRCEQYLKKINPKLIIISESFPNFDVFSSINTYTIKKYSSVSINIYITELFNFIENEEKNEYKKHLQNLIDYFPKPISNDIKENILKKTKELKNSFLSDNHAEKIALEIFDEIKKSAITDPTINSAENQTMSQPTINGNKNTIYKPIGFIKDMFLKKFSK